MNKKDKEEMTKLITDALNDVVIPAIEDSETRVRKDMATKRDIADVRSDIDTLSRKFDAQQSRLDRHGKDIEQLQSAIVG